MSIQERDPVGSVGLLVGRRGTPDVVGGRVLGYHAMNYIVRGTGVFRDAAGAEEAVGPGSMFSLRPGVWHRFAPDTAWDEYYVTFDGAAVRRAFGDIIVGPPGHHRVAPDPALASAFEELHGLWLQRDRHYAVRSRYLLHVILQRFFDAWHGPAEVGDGLVAQALGLMRASLAADRIDLERFARERGVSYERFRKRFAGQTGRSPHRCWLDMKLRQAGTLLRANRLSVREVAAAVGIDDPYYFSRLFTRLHGMSPQAFRRS
jgi:AraC-like DNA-binding protein